MSRVATQSITHPEALSFFLATVCQVPAHNSPEHAGAACSFCTMVLVPPKAPALAVEPPSVSSYLPRLVSRLRPSVSSTLKNILKSSACSGRREALAANHQATRGHEIDLFTPPHHPYNTAEEAHTLPGRARPKDPECPSRLPHPTTAMRSPTTSGLLRRMRSTHDRADGRRREGCPGDVRECNLRACRALWAPPATTTPCAGGGRVYINMLFEQIERVRNGRFDCFLQES